jgi:hypothetical protein
MAAINELKIAETGALSRIKGAVVLRNEKRASRPLPTSSPDRCSRCRR